jgi:hypothetical protein
MKDVAQELESILTVADQLRSIHEGAAARRPGTGKWSKKEILGHLIDSAANNHQRFVRLQLQGKLELPGYDGDDWVRIQNYQNLPWHDIIDLWRVYNRHLARMIRDVDPASLKHRWHKPDGGVLDLEFIMRDYVVHLKHHIDRILER